MVWRPANNHSVGLWASNSLLPAPTLQNTNISARGISIATLGLRVGCISAIIYVLSNSKHQTRKISGSNKRGKPLRAGVGLGQVPRKIISDSSLPVSYSPRLLLLVVYWSFLSWTTSSPYKSIRTSRQVIQFPLVLTITRPMRHHPMMPTPSHNVSHLGSNPSHSN
jgi:hypothetical protein